MPAGYFDQLTDQIMAQIPEEKVVGLASPAASHAIPRRAMKVSLWKRMGMGKIAAAIAAVVLLGGGMLIGLQHQGKRDAQMAHASHAAGNQLYYNSEDASFDQMADYAMMDSQDFYAQLVAEN
uniref:hypothetical protein n=1 Tax=Prevotella sp. TaxID=59823 RepID=UPI003FEF737B